jgi:hypothetical protein
VRTALLLLLAGLSAVLAADGAVAAGSHGDGRAWFVKAGAASGGTGSRQAPFGSLAEAERASAPGERIVVRRSRAPLDGGIALKRGQRLIGAGPSVRKRAGAGRAPRIANTTAERNSGDAVVLADGATARNLRIEGAYRGAIYGENVTGVRVRGNSITGHNASCAEGFHIPPFNVPASVPGAGVPISAGLKNGWAAIMVDADRGKGTVAIANNEVVGSECGDGIDLRMSQSADYRASVRRNSVADLRQGEELESVLAFGLQTRDRSRLRARLAGNSQTNLGNEEDPGAGPAGADSEGVFVNPVDGSILRARIVRNTYTNPNGLGGFSANGLEYVTMGDGSRSSVEVMRSTFTEATGDVIEQLGLGTNARMRLRMDDVVATDSRGAAGSGFGNTVLIPGNNADCLIAASGGAGNTIETMVRGGELSRCANNGITFGSAVANGSGPTTLMDLDVAGTRITANRGANLRVGNETELDRLAVKVAGSDLSDAAGTGSGAANVSFEELGSTAESAIDLGGGTLGSAGANCLDGGSLAAVVVGYDVTATGNWWGQPGGPRPGSTLTTGGTFTTEPSLATPPPGC